MIRSCSPGRKCDSGSNRLRRFQVDVVISGYEPVFIANMPSNAFCEIYLQLTWHTKSHCAILRGSVEARVHGFLRARIADTPEAFVYEIGGIEDHVHLAVRIGPSLKISDWIGELKGSSTHYLNRHLRRRIPFVWQRGYGAVSFGKKDLPFVVDYIRRQKEHHRGARIFDRLERIHAGTPAPDHG